MPGSPPAGDVGDGADRDLAQQGEHGGGVDERRPQELVDQGMPGAGPGLVVQAAPGPVQQRRPDQRVPVAAQPIRMQADQDIARPGWVVPAWAEKAVPFDNADGEPCQVHLTHWQLTGVLGQFAAEDRTTGLTAAICNAGHDGGHRGGVKVPPELVVQKKERFGTLTDEVVDAHRHEVYRRSSPAVRPATATASFVPTPSVVATRTGWRYPAGMAKRPPKPPMPPITSGRTVLSTAGPMSRTASSPASMSTPAAA